ncbi:MAG: hypothetical protein Q4B50_05180, partial [Bacillota bacterium]|nr:hypothetical protein [Bacillota bacterium]
ELDKSRDESSQHEIKGMRENEDSENDPLQTGFILSNAPSIENPSVQPIHISKPEAPRFLFFKRVINAIFGAYGKELRSYDKEMERYNDYVNMDIIRGAEEQPLRMEMGNAEVPNSIREGSSTSRERNIRMLEDTLSNFQSFYPEHRNNNRFEGFSEAAESIDAHYKIGLEMRLRSISILKNGDYELAGMRFFEEALSHVMLGEMISRSVNQDRDEFFTSVQSGSVDLEQCRQQLLDTPAAREILAQGAEGLGRVMVNSVHLNKLVDKAILQANGARLRGNESREDLVNSRSMSNGNQRKNDESMLIH